MSVESDSPFHKDQVALIEQLKKQREQTPTDSELYKLLGAAIGQIMGKNKDNIVTIAPDKETNNVAERLNGAKKRISEFDKAKLENGTATQQELEQFRKDATTIASIQKAEQKLPHTNIEEIKLDIERHEALIAALEQGNTERAMTALNAIQGNDAIEAQTSDISKKVEPFSKPNKTKPDIITNTEVLPTQDSQKFETAKNEVQKIAGYQVSTEEARYLEPEIDEHLKTIVSHLESKRGLSQQELAMLHSSRVLLAANADGLTKEDQHIHFAIVAKAIETEKTQTAQKNTGTDKKKTQAELEAERVTDEMVANQEAKVDRAEKLTKGKGFTKDPLEQVANTKLDSFTVLDYSKDDPLSEGAGDVGKLWEPGSESFKNALASVKNLGISGAGLGIKSDNRNYSNAELATDHSGGAVSEDLITADKQQERLENNKNTPVISV